MVRLQRRGLSDRRHGEEEILSAIAWRRAGFDARSIGRPTPQLSAGSGQRRASTQGARTESRPAPRLKIVRDPGCSRTARRVWLAKSNTWTRIDTGVASFPVRRTCRNAVGASVAAKVRLSVNRRVPEPTVVFAGDVTASISMPDNASPDVTGSRTSTFPYTPPLNPVVRPDTPTLISWGPGDRFIRATRSSGRSWLSPGPGSRRS